MAKFPRHHGIRLAKGESWFENLVIESLSSDPTIEKEGRIWHNSTENVYKGSFDDGTGGYTIKVFSTSDDLLNYITFLSSGEGAANIGFDGHTSSGWAVPSGTLADTLDTIINKIASVEASGSDGIYMYDEGTDVLEHTRKINVVGEGAMLVQSGPEETTLYVPSPSFAPMYNMDEANVENIGTTNRRVANPTLNQFEIGDWNPTGSYSTIKDTTLIYNTNNKCGFNDKTTTLTAQVIGADGTTVIAQNQITNVDENSGTTTVNGIEININDWESDYFRYKAYVNITFDLSVIIPNGGRFEIKIMHDNSILGTYTKTQGPLFFDPNESANDPSIAALNIIENTPVTKWLSGVQYYDEGSTFDISVLDIDRINNLTWPNDNNLIYISSNGEFGISNFYLTASSSSITGWTSDWDNDNLSVTTTKTIDRDDFRYIGTAANISGRWIDWSTGPYQNSPTKTVLIDTYDVDATTLNEEFNDESRRLQSDLTTPWNSMSELGTNDLMVQSGKLKRAYGNWQTYLPTNTVDYNDVNIETQSYYREFIDSGTSHSNGKFQLGGITETDLTNNDIIIWISTNGTDWYNCNSDYSSGMLTNGDGCRINKITEQMPYLEFTLGTGGSTDAGSGSAGFGLFVKIDIRNGSSVELEYIRIINW